MEEIARSCRRRIGEYLKSLDVIGRPIVLWVNITEGLDYYDALEMSTNKNSV